MGWAMSDEATSANTAGQPGLHREQTEHVGLSDPDAEIPGTQVGKPESLGPVTQVNRQLYLAVIIILGAVLVIGVIGWIILALNHRSMPEGLGVILGAVAGGLVALISDKSSG